MYCRSGQSRRKLDSGFLVDYLVVGEIALWLVDCREGGHIEGGSAAVIANEGGCCAEDGEYEDGYGVRLHGQEVSSTADLEMLKDESWSSVTTSNKDLQHSRMFS